jgi:hypothetical protein
MRITKASAMPAVLATRVLFQMDANSGSKAISTAKTAIPNTSHARRID